MFYPRRSRRLRRVACRVALDGRAARGCADRRAGGGSSTRTRHRADVGERDQRDRRGAHRRAAPARPRRSRPRGASPTGCRGRRRPRRRGSAGRAARRGAAGCASTRATAARGVARRPLPQASASPAVQRAGAVAGRAAGAPRPSSPPGLRVGEEAAPDHRARVPAGRARQPAVRARRGRGRGGAARRLISQTTAAASARSGAARGGLAARHRGRAEAVGEQRGPSSVGTAEQPRARRRVIVQAWRSRARPLLAARASSRARFSTTGDCSAASPTADAGLPRTACSRQSTPWGRKLPSPTSG